MARELQREAAHSSGGEILGKSPAIRRLLEDVSVVAGSDLPVLIDGETGVGKELVARAVHEASSRRDEVLIQVNCAALPETLAESELFGHVAGAFTGAVRNREGKFELADGGTLFLDEIGELPVSLQPKLLRALQQGEIQRVGSDQALRVDVRVVAATNRDLERAVERGALPRRPVPPPRRLPDPRPRAAGAARRHPAARRPLRGEQPPAPRPLPRPPDRARPRGPHRRRLARQRPRAPERGHPRRAARRLGGAPRSGRSSSPSTTSTCASRKAPRAPSHERGADAEDRTPTSPDPRPLADRVDSYKRGAILSALEDNDGNWAAAARDLGLHRSNLHHLAKRLGLR